VAAAVKKPPAFASSPLVDTIDWPGEADRPDASFPHDRQTRKTLRPALAGGGFL